MTVNNLISTRKTMIRHSFVALFAFALAGGAQAAPYSLPSTDERPYTKITLEGGLICATWVDAGACDVEPGVEYREHRFTPGWSDAASNRVLIPAVENDTDQSNEIAAYIERIEGLESALASAEAAAASCSGSLSDADRTIIEVREERDAALAACAADGGSEGEGGGADDDGSTSGDTGGTTGDNTGGGASVDLPRWTIGDLEYVGAARMPKDNLGVSTFKNAGPKLAISDAGTLFATGKSKASSVAEIALPALSTSLVASELPFVTVEQPFAPMLDAAESGNPQGIDIILGMLEAPSGELVVNAERFYDGAGDNTHTTLVAENADDLDASAPRGFYELGGTARAGGWLSPVPAEWQAVLGTEHITGAAGCSAIRTRGTFGPSAYAVDIDDILGASLDNPAVPTTEMMGFTVPEPLADDPRNESGGNDLWTYESCAEYAFIVPGTSTYLAIGHSGGHNSGIGYKITQDDGNVCGGYCAREASDYYNRYWAFDVNDLIAVKRGERAPESIRPYEYGDLVVPFQPASGANFVSGGAFDPETGVLYMSIKDADTTQSRYSTLPVVTAFRVGAR